MIGLAATGLAAGVLSGLFGVGGGILMVPAMVILAGFVQQRAALLGVDISAARLLSPTDPELRGAHRRPGWR